MNADNRTRTAMFNTAKYRSLANAKRAAASQRYFVPVLMGEAGIYLVPSTNREAGILIGLGYEVAE